MVASLGFPMFREARFMCLSERTGGFRDLGTNRFGWKYER